MKLEKGKNLLGILGIAAVFGAFYYLVSHTPLILDDYSYSLNWAAPGRNESLLDVLGSVKVHYLTTNGRLPLHFLAFLFLMLDKWVFNIISALAFCALGFLTYYQGFGSFKKLRWDALFLIYLGFYFCVPSWADSFLWLDGACNYLFGPVIALSYLALWRKDWEGEGRTGWGKAAAMTLFGILAGWTNENLALAVITIEIGYLALRKLHGKKMPLWMILGLLGSILGFLLMIFAPGQMIRAGEDGIQGVNLWFSNILVLTIYLVRNLWELMALWGVLMLLVLIEQKGSLLKWVQELELTVIYLLGAGVSVYSMCAVEYAPPRTWSIMVILCLCTVCCTFSKVTWEKHRLQGAAPAFLLALLLAAHFPANFQAVNRGYRAFQAREAYICAQREAGNLDIIIPAIHSGNSFCVYGSGIELSDEADAWPNDAMAIFYEVNTISLGEDYGIPLNPQA